MIHGGFSTCKVTSHVGKEVGKEVKRVRIVTAVAPYVNQDQGVDNPGETALIEPHHMWEQWVTPQAVVCVIVLHICIAEA